MYQKNYHIGSNDIDQFLELKLSSFFKMMQDIATEHAEVLDTGKAQTIDKGLYWVITRIEIDIIDMPKYLEDVKLVTYPGDDMRFIFPRYFLLYDSNGKLLMRASSTWMVMNRATHNVSLNPFGDYKAEAEHHEDEIPLPRKVDKDEDLSLIEKRKVRYSDIDLNGHLNNTKYIDYIIDLHDSEFYKKNKIRHFVINYEKELKDGEEISLFSNNKNPEYILGSVDKTSFEVNITYRSRG